MATAPSGPKATDITVPDVTVDAKSAAGPTRISDQCGVARVPSKPKVMLLLTCEDGHQVETFPEKVLSIDSDIEKIDTIHAKWECPRCETPKKYEVEL